MRTSVSALSKILANELAPHKIRVNQLIPGRISTDRVKEIDEDNAKRAGITVPEQQKRIFATIPMGRYGDPGRIRRGRRLSPVRRRRLHHRGQPPGRRRHAPRDMSTGVQSLGTRPGTWPFRLV